MRANFDDLCVHLARAIEADHARNGPTVVAVDGPDCSGKSTISRGIISLLKSNYAVSLTHFDDYLNPRGVRERLGEFSVDSFLNFYFDEQALIRSILAPALENPREDQIIIVEGLFLLRPELLPYFSFRIRLDIKDDLLLRRAYRRDIGLLGSDEWVRRHYIEQCLPAQRRYRHCVRPFKAADINVIVHADDDFGVYSAK